MRRTQFIEHRGVRILAVDLSGIQDTPELRSAVEDIKEVVRQEPEGSILAVTDLTGSAFSLEAVGLMRELAVHNKPYVIAAALLGVPNVARFSLAAIARATGRNIRAFPDEDLAKDWLIEQN